MFAFYKDVAWGHWPHAGMFAPENGQPLHDACLRLVFVFSVSGKSGRITFIHQFFAESTATGPPSQTGSAFLGGNHII